MLVVCNGMIRSGSTLQFNIVKGLLEKTGRAVNHGYLDLKAQKQTMPSLIRYAESTKWHFFKAHAIDKVLQTLPKQKNVFIIYVDRNLFDVAASAKFKWKLKEDELIDAIVQAINERQRLKKHSRCLMQAYDVLTTSPYECGREIQAFLNLNLPKECLNKIISDCVLGKTKSDQNPKACTVLREKLYKLIGRLRLGKLAKSFGMTNKTVMSIKNIIVPWNSESLYHPTHQSPWLGKPGAWRDILTASEVEKLILIASRMEQNCSHDFSQEIFAQVI